ncbi:MAG: sugar kinase [Alkalispirochaeta sp.]
MKPLVTFGEVMTRFSTPGFLRFQQTFPGQLDVTFGGAEANVATSVSMLGQPASLVSAVPDNPIGHACLSFLRGLGVNAEHVSLVPDGRLGSYYIEKGANQRPSKVVYDRAGSAMAKSDADSWDWPTILHDSGWFHTTGITPAVSQSAASAAITATRTAKSHGIPVSLDLNYRSKLWKWGDGPHGRELACETMAKILPYVDVVIGNEQDAEDVLGISAQGSDSSAGVIDALRYADVAKEIVARYPNIHTVAITLRESVSATHNRWGAMLYRTDQSGETVAYSPTRAQAYHPYQITAIVDRVGAGDAFGAALIFALRDPELSTEVRQVIDFAVAASALAHSVEGDINYTSRDEVMQLAGGNASGRVQR